MHTEALKFSGTSSLTSLVPRQVMLEINSTVVAGEKVKDRKKKDKKKEKKGSSENQTAGTEQNGVSLTTPGRNTLLRSIAAFLNSNGFARTLEVFLSEAQLELDDVKNSSLDLEDVLCKVIGLRVPFEEKFNNQVEAQDCIAIAEGAEKFEKSKVSLTSQVDEIPKKDKKKKRKEQEALSLEVPVDTLAEKAGVLEKEGRLNGSLVLSKAMKKKSKSNDKPLEEEHVKEVGSGKLREFVEEKMDELRSVIQDKSTDVEIKERKKKNKSHETNVDGDQKVESEAKENEHVSESGSQAPGNAGVDHTLNNNESKPKDKKKKKSKSALEDLAVEQENDKITDKAKSKDSKKRKKSESDAEGISNGDSNVPLNKKLKHEDNDAKNVAEGQDKAQKENPGKPKSNGNQKELPADNAADDSISKKKPELKGSAEPKTVKAFQRVKVDEVQFVDNRLQDNSYWAKDGADSGYGAKAQEVLGQVRGRDFRHEKTKKKRGSYRGGQIDFGSHSIKFNYSDDE